MAFARKCDRCGKYWDVGYLDQLSGRETSFLYKGRRIDLCPECLVGFLKYVDGGDVIDPKGDSNHAEN